MRVAVTVVFKQLQNLPSFFFVNPCVDVCLIVFVTELTNFMSQTGSEPANRVPAEWLVSLREWIFSWILKNLVLFAIFSTVWLNC